jgi:UV DNA damage endonuclease
MNNTAFVPYESRIGYACINLTLAEKGITTNRHAIERTFKTKGLSHISKLCLANVVDLLKVVQWNNENNIKFYRISSSLFPWMTEYQFEDLPDWKEIRTVLNHIGAEADKAEQRLEFHPTHFTILASPNAVTRDRSVRDLNQHARIFDEMGFPPTHWNPLNIHVGGAYGDKDKAALMWCMTYERLSESAKKRIVLENDDKANMFSVMDLYSLVHERVGVPITFDIFHHGFCKGGLTAREAARLAASTWKDAPMVIHWSSSMKLYENAEAKSVAHADYIYDKLEDWGTGGWFMCESKAKDLSIIEYLKTGPRPQNVVNNTENLLPQLV